MTNETTCRWDFFFRAEVNAATLRKLGVTFDQHWTGRPANFVRLDLPATLTVEQAFAAAIATGKVPTGSHRSGCFEIQNDVAGIWSTTNGRRFDFTRPDRIEFTSWED